MKITSTYRLEFKGPGGLRFTTAGPKSKGQIEDAPDWIMEDPYFQANLRVGRVSVIRETPPVAEEPQGLVPLLDPAPANSEVPIEAPKWSEDREARKQRRLAKKKKKELDENEE